MYVCQIYVGLLSGNVCVHWFVSRCLIQSLSSHTSPNRLTDPFILLQSLFKERPKYVSSHLSTKKGKIKHKHWTFSSPSVLSVGLNRLYFPSSLRLYLLVKLSRKENVRGSFTSVSAAVGSVEVNTCWGLPAKEKPDLGRQSNTGDSPLGEKLRFAQKVSESSGQNGTNLTSLAVRIRWWCKRKQCWNSNTLPNDQCFFVSLTHSPTHWFTFAFNGLAPLLQSTQKVANWSSVNQLIY